MKSKILHYNRLRSKKSFTPRDKVLLFNSHLKLIPGILQSYWSGLFTINQLLPYGACDVIDRDDTTFRINEQQLKLFPVDRLEQVIFLET